jgi:multiple sugar transport system substrate-binding protein
MNPRVSLLLVLVTVAGCGSDDDTPKNDDRSFPGTKITVAAVGNPAALEAVKTGQKSWERATGGSVAFLAEAVTPRDLKGADVILFPGDQIGELVDRGALATLHDSAVRPPIPLGSQVLPPDPLAYSDLAPAFREQVSKYGEDRMSLPLGGSGLVLVYRREAFESASNKAAAKDAKITLAPPKTWDELDALIRFFHGRDWDGDGKPESGIAAPLGADPDGVADAIVLARAVSLGQHPDHYGLLFDPETLEPRIASPPFVEALAAIAAWKALSPPKAESFDAEAARAAFRAGEAAMLIDHAEAASRWTDPKSPASVAVAALPASPKVFDPDRKKWLDVPALNKVVYLPKGGGWLVGMSARASGATRAAALDFARTLAGPEFSRQIVSDSAMPMLPTRNAQLSSGLPNPKSAPGVDSTSWGIAVAQTVTAPRIVPGLRIPGTSEYLAALTKARIAAVSGVPAESALADAAKAWAEISKRHGLNRQLWHYRRSLNRLVTDANAPAR